MSEKQLEHFAIIKKHIEFLMVDDSMHDDICLIKSMQMLRCNIINRVSGNFICSNCIE